MIENEHLEGWGTAGFMFTDSSRQRKLSVSHPPKDKDSLRPDAGAWLLPAFRGVGLLTIVRNHNWCEAGFREGGGVQVACTGEILDFYQGSSVLQHVVVTKKPLFIQSKLSLQYMIL